jgi:uncharacterized membrane protein
MRSNILLKICLGLGLVAYCLVILVSQDAPVFTLALMGTLTLSLILIPMGLMWRGWINSNEDTQNGMDSDTCLK